MRNFKIAFRSGLAVSLLMVSTNGFCVNVGSPENVKIKFYEMWVSPNTDCSGLTRIYNDANPSYQDVVAGPTFGQVNVANGTYPCIAWKMSDIVKLTPAYDSTGGFCQQGVEITRDLFRGGDTSRSPDGVTINGSGTNPGSPIEDTMWVYLSTNGDNALSCNTPSVPCRITSPYIVGGDNAATMVFDFTNGIEDTGSSCSPENVTFGFRYQ